MTQRSRSARAGGPGWLASLVSAGLLVVVGFAVGLFAGVTFEDPALVLSHWRGETESVDLATLPGELESGPAGRADAELLPLGAEAPPGADPGEAAAAPPGSPTRRGPDLPAVSAPAPAGGFMVQVGAFAERGAAERLRERLEQLDLPVTVEPGEGASDVGWRVRVGPLAGEGEAQRMAQRLKTEQKLPTWVVAPAKR